MARLGFVGAGLMGHGMAANLLKAGHGVRVIAHCNRAPVDDLLGRGATEVRTLAGSRAASSNDDDPTLRRSMPAVTAPAASSEQSHSLSELRAEVAGLREELARLHDSTASLRARLDVLERREG